MTIISTLLLLNLLSITLNTVAALECYVCNNQEDNTGKCVTTIKTCKQGEDVCLSEIRWGSTPFWTQGALKQFYISKDCSTKFDCQRYRESNMPLCTHIWYEDWKCSECCKGDRCNYYVFSNAYRSVSNVILILMTCFAVYRVFS